MRLQALTAATILLAACTATPEASRAENASTPTAPVGAGNEQIGVAEAGDAANIANAVAAEAAAPLGTPALNSCHNEECSWSVTRSQALVRRSAAGSLWRLTLLGGTSEHEDENYPEDSRGVPIAWNAAPHEVFVFCSRRLPAVILPDHGRLQVDVLDFVNGPVTALESSASLYARICHPGEDWASNGFAARHGYQAREDEADVDLARPEDIFRLAE